MKRKVLIGSALALSLVAAGAAWAKPEAPQHSDQPDSQAVGKAKITLADAATAAERHAARSRTRWWRPTRICRC